MVHEAVRMTCVNSWDSNMQLSAPKSPFLKLGNNTLQKQVEKNAPRSNEWIRKKLKAPRTAKCLQFFFSLFVRR